MERAHCRIARLMGREQLAAGRAESLVRRPARLHLEAELSSRRVQRVLVASVSAVVVIAMSVSADGAAGGHGKPTAKSIFAKGHAATPQAAARSLDEGDGDGGSVDA